MTQTSERNKYQYPTYFPGDKKHPAFVNVGTRMDPSGLVHHPPGHSVKDRFSDVTVSAIYRVPCVALAAEGCTWGGDWVYGQKLFQFSGDDLKEKGKASFPHRTHEDVKFNTMKIQVGATLGENVRPSLRRDRKCGKYRR